MLLIRSDAFSEVENKTIYFSLGFWNALKYILFCGSQYIKNDSGCLALFIDFLLVSNLFSLYIK